MCFTALSSTILPSPLPKILQSLPNVCCGSFISFHHLLSEAHLKTIGLGTICDYIRILSAIISLACFQFMFGSIRPLCPWYLSSLWFLLLQALWGVEPPWQHGSQVGKGIVYQFHNFCSTFTTGHLVECTKYRWKVLWLGWYPNLATGSLAGYRR